MIPLTKAKFPFSQFQILLNMKVYTDKYASVFASSPPKSTISKEGEKALEQINEKGYVILENVLTESEINSMIEALQPHMTKKGRNNFEGTETNRLGK